MHKMPILLFIIIFVNFSYIKSEINSSIKSIQTKSTINCIGIKLDLVGDDNLNATCTVQFRAKNSDNWKSALNLFRVTHKWKVSSMNEKGRDVNALSGSIFNLAPGTEYEVKLTFNDPDGAKEEKTFLIFTKYPKSPNTKPISVPPGKLEEILKNAKAGDVLLLEKGYHGKDFTITNSGSPDNYIFITGAGIHEAKIDGKFTIEGNYIWIDNIHINQPKVEFPIRGSTGVLASNLTHDLVVTRCLMENVIYGVHTHGHTCIASDNKIIGDKPDWTPMDQIYPHPVPERRKGQLGGEGIDFGHHQGGNFVAAFNDISKVADGVSYGDNNTDVYNNEIYLITDDQIEPDYAYDNYRVWGNRGRTGLTGLSFQPLNGGPWYFFRNQISGNGSYIFKIKDNDGRGPCVFLNNTFIQTIPYYRNHVIMLSGGIWVNNVWGNLLGGHLGSTYEDFTKDKTMLLDYNAYHTGESSFFQKARKPILLKDVQANGLEINSFQIDIFKELNNLEAKVEERDPGTSKPLYPKENSKLIDTGLFVNNVSLPYMGNAPDRGAFESGMGFSWFGPRLYSPNGFCYGLPENWVEMKMDDKNSPISLINNLNKAKITVKFKKLNDSNFEAIQKEHFKSIDSKNIKVFFDSTYASEILLEEKGAFFALQKDFDGVWLIEGECSKKDFNVTQNDFYTFIASIQRTCSIRINKE